MSTSENHREAVQANHKDEYDEPEDAGYSLDHLSAVVRPVMLTMALAAYVFCF